MSGSLCRLHPRIDRVNEGMPSSKENRKRKGGVQSFARQVLSMERRRMPQLVSLQSLRSPEPHSTAQQRAAHSSSVSNSWIHFPLPTHMLPCYQPLSHRVMECFRIPWLSRKGPLNPAQPLRTWLNCITSGCAPPPDFASGVVWGDAIGEGRLRWK